MLTLFGDDYSTDIEVISFWESEELRLEWVAGASGTLFELFEYLHRPHRHLNDWVLRIVLAYDRAGMARTLGGKVLAYGEK